MKFLLHKTAKQLLLIQTVFPIFVTHYNKIFGFWKGEEKKNRRFRRFFVHLNSLGFDKLIDIQDKNRRAADLYFDWCRRKNSKFA